MDRCLRITSSSNRIIKEIRELSDRKGRTRAGAFKVEGGKLAIEAAENGAAFRYIVLAESYISRYENSPLPGRPWPVYLLPDELFARISDTETPQGILAVAELPGIPDIASLRLSRCVILENLQDPGNVGTIIRTADACGFDGVLLSSGCADPYSPKVLRAAMGSVFHMPVIPCADIYGTVRKLKDQGIRIASAHPRDSGIIWESDIADRIALVIGNEGNGLSDIMLDLCDIRVMIPMPGKAESLNAAAAASMLIYESMRQRECGTCMETSRIG